MGTEAAGECTDWTLQPSENQAVRRFQYPFLVHLGSKAA